MRVRVAGAGHAKMSGQHVAVLVSAAVWSERHHGLASSRAQVVCRMQAVRCELVPGGVPGKIIAAHAAPAWLAHARGRGELLLGAGHGPPRRPARR
jgi:hypothetical protein